MGGSRKGNDSRKDQGRKAKKTGTAGFDIQREAIGI